MHKICFTVSLFHASTCFEHHVLNVRKSKYYYTASGIITPVGGRPVHRSREDTFTHKQYTKQKIETDYNIYITIKIHKHKIRIYKPVHRTATYTYDDTRGYKIQFWPPDVEHMVLETCTGMK